MHSKKGSMGRILEYGAHGWIAMLQLDNLRGCCTFPSFVLLSATVRRPSLRCGHAAGRVQDSEGQRCSDTGCSVDASPTSVFLELGNPPCRQSNGGGCCPGRPTQLPDGFSRSSAQRAYP